MSNITRMSWDDVSAQVELLAARNKGKTFTDVYGIPSGGVPVATLVAPLLGLALAETPTPGRTLIVDDLVDSGTTLRRYQGMGHHADALWRKPTSPTDLAPGATVAEGWLSFPWEKDDGDPTDAVLRILQHIGEDPTREGLRDTPRRVIKAFRELTVGYSMDPKTILATTFDVTHDEMIVVRDVAFSSLCEHHMLPFHGVATVGYIPAPGGRIVGLSKIPRLIECFARRLQVQERMTDQIAEALEQNLDTQGVGVILRASHSCMSMRGIGKHGEMVTSRLTGDFRHKPEARAEFMGLGL